MGAFGEITTGSLVRTIGTIHLAIAYAGRIYATIRYVRTLPLLGLALECRRTTCMQFSVFVGAISAVVLAITDIRLKYASLVPASEKYVKLDIELDKNKTYIFIISLSHHAF